VVAVLTVVVLGVTALTLVLVLGRGHSHTIHGALDVGTVQLDSRCRLAPLYQGITKGTEVTITDTSGHVVGRSTLGFGRGIGPFCEFLFTAEVPDRTMYNIEVDHRGLVKYSKAYLEFYRWRVGLALRSGTLTWV
jgi:hypothetical protein